MGIDRSSRRRRRLAGSLLATWAAAGLACSAGAPAPKDGVASEASRLSLPAVPAAPAPLELPREVPGPPLVVGLLGGPEAVRSRLVVFDDVRDARKGPRTLAEISHAEGWVPSVAIDPERRTAYASIVTRIERPGALAALRSIDLGSGAETLLAAAVPPRQAAIPDRRGGVVYVTHEAWEAAPEGRGAMQLEQLRLLVARPREAPRVLISLTGYLLWPLFLGAGGGEVLVLIAAPGRSELAAVSLEGGGVRVLQRFGSDGPGSPSGREGPASPARDPPSPEAVRDFHLEPGGRGVTYERALGGGRYAVERIELATATRTTLFEDAHPWLVPLPLTAGVLIARTESATLGSLVLLGANGAKRELALPPELGPAAPIPEAALGEHALVRLQGKADQRYVVVRVGDAASETYRLETGGLLLGSGALLPRGAL